MSAVAEPGPAQAPSSASAMIQLMNAFWEIALIQRVGYSENEEGLHIWVWFREDRAEEMERAALAEREFRRAAGRPAVDIHYLALSKIDPQHRPPSKTVFERV